MPTKKEILDAADQGFPAYYETVLKELPQHQALRTYTYTGGFPMVKQMQILAIRQGSNGTEAEVALDVMIMPHRTHNGKQTGVKMEVVENNQDPDCRCVWFDDAFYDYIADFVRPFVIYLIFDVMQRQGITLDQWESLSD